MKKQKDKLLFCSEKNYRKNLYAVRNKSKLAVSE